MKQFTTLLFYLLFSTALLAQKNASFYDSNRFGEFETLEPFYHGVASGDPTESSVILWTRISTDSLLANIQWTLARDTGMTDIVDQGWVITDGESDFTVKIDVQNLDPYTTYYYDFYSQEKYSLRGRTKTAPSGNIDSLRFAVVSCSNFAHGFFHVYDKLVDRNDIDAVIHLGDYIYEYGDGEFGDVRELEPSQEILTISDYRMRHSYYKLDPHLRRLHQQYPIISTWDDHESANNAWYGGAENHNPGQGEGDWFERKSASIQVYNEWMPIRTPDMNDSERIYRKLSYGNLMDLFVLDTRIYGRDEQGGDSSDPNRTILGANQTTWLQNELINSSAKWQVLGNQVMVAPLEVFGNPVNDDQWDGYQAERDNLYNTVINNNVPNMVVLTGDIHTSWANDLPMDGYDEDTGANSAGVEFVTTSVTSPGLPLPGLENLILPFNTHIKWANLDNRGYLILDINNTRCQGDWYFIGSVTDATTTDSHANSWFTNDGTRHLQEANAPSDPKPSIFAIYAPEDPRSAPMTPNHNLNELAFVGVHPNPASNDIYLQFFNHETVDMTLVIHDVTGKELIIEDLGKRQAGLQNKTIDVSSLSSGTYFVVLKTALGSYRKTIIKQ